MIVIQRLQAHVITQQGYYFCVFVIKNFSKATLATIPVLRVMDVFNRKRFIEPSRIMTADTIIGIMYRPSGRIHQSIAYVIFYMYHMNHQSPITNHQSRRILFANSAIYSSIEAQLRMLPTSTGNSHGISIGKIL